MIRDCAAGGVLPAQIMETVRVYNTIPAGDDLVWQQAVDAAWRAHCGGKAADHGK